MISRKFIFISLIMPLALAISSCSGNSVKSSEPEIATMDSVSKELDQTNEQLEEKTKNLEASLEKADKELETAK
jgi:hypothetical protein